MFTKTRDLLSIVVPCYNEEDVILGLVDQLTEFASSKTDLQIEVIAVDDGSTDQTYDLLKKLSQNSPFLKILRLSRNFGHQIALTAGIEASSGNAVVLMDADLQDPIKVVDRMIERWRNGFDVIYGLRKKRLGISAVKSATAKIFYRVFNMMADVPIPNDTGDFRLMSRKVVDVLLSMPEKDRFLRGMVSWVGFRQTSVEFERQQRVAGKTKYSFRKLKRLGTDGLFSSTYVPLQFSTYFGLLSIIVSTTAGVAVLVERLTQNQTMTISTVILIVLGFIGGVQLLSIGILGSYISRIHTEVRGRPLYIVREQIGFGQIFNKNLKHFNTDYRTFRDTI